MTAITISRQLGSRGDEIASQLADQLKFRYFDKRLLAEAAAESGLSKEHVFDFSEEHYEVRSFLTRLFRSGPRPVKTVSVRQRDTAGTTTVTEETFDEMQYIDLVKRSIQAAYEEDDIVIVGRGGQAILQDKPNVIHIRVVAPQDIRAARLQLYDDVTAEEAHRRITQQDRATAEYLDRFFHVHVDDDTLYDLIINTSRLSVEAAVKIVMDAITATRVPVA